MTRSATPRPTAQADALRTLEHLLLGALFLGAIAMLSLPAARGASATLGWMPLWLLGLPAASLATAFALRLSRRVAMQAPSSAPRRRRPATFAATRRRTGAPRRASRLLAAIVLR
ncbi:hypothetical protein FQY83_06400 [Luteimonas marina]|uniref:Transmembrane protein n=1 Tax=Luteimonas marina TaxID=488485 RepID=A0A5C5UAX7_9GAMM|nr:hypothetical protein [Luteimonas marina]TWT22642.1 hypothetical protein FQY83_06400 [Luteimonas marina]